MTLNLLVVDDHRLIREAIRARLAGTDVSVREAASGVDAITEAGRQPPDVVLLDLNLPDLPGRDVCTSILEQAPGAAVIVLSGYTEEEMVRQAVASGARAYLLKGAEELDLVETIERVLTGEIVLDPRVAGALGEPRPKLSTRELDVVRLAAQGLTNREIGLQLHLSRHTVKEYMGQAMQKLEVSGRVEAVLEANRRGLI